MMISLFLSALALAGQDVLAGNAASPSEVRLSAENRAKIRCSAAFAIVGGRRSSNGTPAQSAELNRRGREFFVVTLAGLMDEHKLSREAVADLVREEAARLRKSGEVDAIMPSCLLMLQASGV